MRKGEVESVDEGAVISAEGKVWRYSFLGDLGGRCHIMVLGQDCDRVRSRLSSMRRQRIQIQVWIGQLLV